MRKNPKKEETFTDRALRAARIKFKRVVTLAEIGKLAGGITQPSVSGWNQKKDGGPKLANAIQLAQKLGVCVEWLYTAREPMFAGPPEEGALARLLDYWPVIDDLAKGEIIGIAAENAREKGATKHRNTGDNHVPA